MATTTTTAAILIEVAKVSKVFHVTKSANTLTHTHTPIYTRAFALPAFSWSACGYATIFFLLPSATLIRILWHLPRALLMLQLATAHIKTDTKSSVCVCAYLNAQQTNSVRERKRERDTRREKALRANNFHKSSCPTVLGLP